MTYVPTLEDVAVLVDHNPEFFSNPLQARRSLEAAARQSGGNTGDIIEQNTARAHYQDYLSNGGPELAEAPMTADASSPGLDLDQGAPVCDCEAPAPCIEEIVVKCHESSNTRVTLKGENELAETGGKIYFVADSFVSGEASFENFLRGIPLKDTAKIDVTISDECTHASHVSQWTDDPGDIQIAGKTASLDYVVQTNPRPTPLNTDLFEPPHEAFEAAAIALDLMINREIMRKEERFQIIPNAGASVGFTSVTVPQLKFIGSVSVEPPRRSERRVPGSEGRQIMQDLGMGTRPRFEETAVGWKVGAALTIVCGNNTKQINLASSSRQRVSLVRNSTGASRSRQSSVSRVIGTVSNATKGLAQRLTNERDESKLTDLYTEGPTLTLELGTEQNEEQGGPGLVWVLTFGLSIDFRFGIVINIYEALKRAARRHPAGAALVAFLEDAERGRNLWVAEYQINPQLFIDFSLGIGSAPTEDLSGDANFNAKLDIVAGTFEPEGHITGTATAVVGGGISGFFDSIVTDRTVFRYEANVATTGGVTIKAERDRWGYEFFHRGAVLRVISFKRVNTSSSANSERTTGIMRRSSSVETTTTTQWMPDRSQTNSYRLAEAWQGPFTPF